MNRQAIIDSQNTSDISTLETYYLNFIASRLYPQKWLKCSENEYWQHVDAETIGKE